MRKRLPLAAVPAPSTETSSERDVTFARVTLGPHTLGIADTTTGLEAVNFALELTVVLRALGYHPAWVLTDFATAPSLPTAVAATLRASQVEVASVRIDGAATLPADPSRPQLWLGIPAVAALAPARTILLQADAPKPSWPPALRTLREPIDLLLGTARPGLAVALVTALRERGFLPQTAQVVR